MEDGGHVAGGGEVAAAGRFLEVAEGVLAGFGGELEEVVLPETSMPHGYG